jgi:hypothetical protein
MNLLERKIIVFQNFYTLKPRTTKNNIFIYLYYALITLIQSTV